MKTIEVKFEDVTYVVSPMNVEQAELIYVPEKEVKLAQKESVVACVNNGGGAKLTMEELLKMPHFIFRRLVDAVMEINEMKPAAPGEAAAAPKS